MTNHVDMIDKTSRSYKQLIAVLQPEGNFQLDWQYNRQSSDLETQVIPTQVIPSESQAAIPPDAQVVQEDIYSQYLRGEHDLFFRLAFVNQSDGLSESLCYLMEIAVAFLRKLALDPDLESLRGQATAELGEEDAQQLIGLAPFMHGQSWLDRAWIEQAWQHLHDAYRHYLQQWDGSIAQLLSTSRAHIQIVGRVYFHLVENKDTDDYPFSFMATYAAESKTPGKSRHLPLKNALIEYSDNKDKLLQLLSTVNKAAANSSLIAELVESGDIFHPIGLLSGEAYTFLTEVTMYEQSGILCRIPKWWTSKSRAVTVSLNVGGKEPAQLGADTLLSFDTRLLLGGDTITEEELRQLLAEAEGLAFLKGKWVEVNHARLRKALEAYEKAQQAAGGEDLTIAEAMRLTWNRSQIAGTGEASELVEVTQGEWFQQIQRKLQNPASIDNAHSPGDHFHATLRAYQAQGLNWLATMKSLGLGACLADDMGLGKTIQIIALLNAIRTKRRERALLVVPASLIGNWTSELARFAPSITYVVWHPSANKEMDEEAGRKLSSTTDCDLVITTYGLLLRYDWLLQVKWDVLILDEAQAIKNPGTKQTHAVKKIKASAKIALTGTPVENRLSDLWSLFDFLNPGLLGTAKEFTTFARRANEEAKGYHQLKQTVSPFILRRLKTDKSIISDLPDKIEMKSYASLTRKQIVLYSKLVQDLQQQLASTEEGIQRRGLILASLMKFKQICNHPDQYLGQNVYHAEDSGKFARLQEICETILEKRERVLLFTQFKEMTEPLRAFLEQIFQHKGMVLHGGTPVAKRRDIVTEFQGEAYIPFLVLSIKAGGVGLNLTNANHVIHFDRWWNPAVENQATDRAFRIGQQRNVLVHKFVTQGTIEDKIDQLIEDKIKLTNEIIPDKQENWITEMDNTQLIELMRFSS